MKRTVQSCCLFAALVAIGLALPAYAGRALLQGRTLLQDCQPSGTLTVDLATVNANCQFPGLCCDQSSYPTYTCSPPIDPNGTPALLTVNDFSAGGDGGDVPSCLNNFIDGTTYPVVAISTGWYNTIGCKAVITISYNGQSVDAAVVDMADSSAGCDATHAYLPPTPINNVDASDAVWQALGIDSTNPSYGYLDSGVTWTVCDGCDNPVPDSTGLWL